MVLWLLHRRDLGSTYDTPPRAEPHDRVLMQIAGGVCVLLAPAFVLGVQPALASVPAAGILARRDLLARARAAAPDQDAVAHRHGHLRPLPRHRRRPARSGSEAWLRTVVGHGTGSADLCRVSGLGVLSSNGINNLPAYLALEPTVADSPARLAALLIGVNAGPIVTMWGSVATLLWASALPVRGPVGRRRPHRPHRALCARSRSWSPRRWPSPPR